MPFRNKERQADLWLLLLRAFFFPVFLLVASSGSYCSSGACMCFCVRSLNVEASIANNAMSPLENIADQMLIEQSKPALTQSPFYRSGRNAKRESIPETFFGFAPLCRVAGSSSNGALCGRVRACLWQPRCCCSARPARFSVPESGGISGEFSRRKLGRVSLDRPSVDVQGVFPLQILNSSVVLVSVRVARLVTGCCVARGMKTCMCNFRKRFLPRPKHY